MLRSFFVASAIFLTYSAACFSQTSNQLLLRYPERGDGVKLAAVATDVSGNIFTAAYSNSELRFNKLSASGVTVASLSLPTPLSGGASAQVTAAATDAQGNLIVIGNISGGGPTGYSGFPLQSALSTSGFTFLVKIDSQLKTIWFSTLLANTLLANAVALDSQGNIYVTGQEISPAFPGSPGAYSLPAQPGSSFLFIMEISSAGNQVLYSTAFGGHTQKCTHEGCSTTVATNTPTSIAVDSTGAIFLAGRTTAVDFPVTAGTVGPTCDCAAFALSPTGAFVTKVAPAHDKLLWSTYINGGSVAYSSSSVNSLAFDAAGNIVIAGTSDRFPATSGALQSLSPLDGSRTGFVAKLNPSASAILWATDFGTAAVPDAEVNAIAVDPLGNIAITGYSDPRGLPPFPGTVNLGNTYTARISGDGTRLTEMYIGSNNSAGMSLALLPSGNFVSAGASGSLWIETSTSGGSLLSTASAASAPVSPLVTPYELFSLYGMGIGPTNPIQGQVVNNSFTTSLSGYSVTFDGVAVPLTYASSLQFNVVVPQSVAVKSSAHIQITGPSGTLDGPTLGIRTAEPYLFPNPATGTNVVLNQDLSVNSQGNPAAPGSIVVLWATGIPTQGWTDGQLVPAGQPRQFPVTVLGGLSNSQQPLEIVYAGDAPGEVAGLVQINVRIPANPTLEPGTYSYEGYFPFTIAANGVTGGSGVIAVSRQ